MSGVFLNDFSILVHGQGLSSKLKVRLARQHVPESCLKLIDARIITQTKNLGFLSCKRSIKLRSSCLP